MPAQLRRAAVRQFRPDPHLRRIREPGAEADVAARPARRPRRHEPRHERARRRLSRDRSRHQRQARRLTLRHQRHQAVFHLQPGRQDIPDLCPFRARARRHRLGDRRARHARLRYRHAVELHERRRVVRAAFRQLPHPGREHPARPGRFQEADRRLQRRAHRQCDALARVRALRLQRGARACRDPQAVRPPAVRVPGPAMEVRRHGAEARGRAAAALSRGRQRRPRPALGLRDLGRQGGVQSRRLRGRARGRAGDGRDRLQPRHPGRMVHAAHARLDDRGRLGRDAQEPHRRARVRPPLRPARPARGCGGARPVSLRAKRSNLGNPRRDCFGVLRTPRNDGG